MYTDLVHLEDFLVFFTLFLVFMYWERSMKFHTSLVYYRLSLGILAVKFPKNEFGRDRVGNC